MTTPKFRDLTFEELLARDWQVQTRSPLHRYRGIHVCTLVLPNEHGGVIHADTGQGSTTETAREKAVEVANDWRRQKAADRSRDA